MFDLEIQFCYKILQGLNFDHPCHNLRLNYCKLLIGLTGVKHRNNLHILGEKGRNEFDLHQLCKLKPDPAFFDWLKASPC